MSDDDLELAGTRDFLGDEPSESDFDALMQEEEEAVALLQWQRPQAADTPARGGDGAIASATDADVQELSTPPLHRAAHQPQAANAATAPPWGRAQRSDGADQAPGSAGHVRPDFGGGHAAAERDELIPSFGGLACSGSSGGLAPRPSPATRLPTPQSAPVGGADSKAGRGGRGAGDGRRLFAPGKDQAGGWEPSVACTALTAVAGLALALAWFITSAVLSAPDPPSCITYQPTDCLLSHNGSEGFQPPRCEPHACAFDAAALACPLAAHGSFRRVRKRAAHEPCALPFLEGARRRIMPPCQTACCDGDLPGGFRPASEGPAGSQEWQPVAQRRRRHSGSRKDQTCSYFKYTGAEVLLYLQRNNVRIVVVGDTLMRQLHARLAHMFRGTAQPIDYRVGGLARYAVCRAGDSFTVDPKSVVSPNMRPVPAKDLQPLVQQFSGRLPAAPGCDNGVARAGDAPVAIDYMHATRFAWQVKMLRAYQPELRVGERLVVIIAVNAAEKEREVPVEWMHYLDSMRKSARLIVVGSPTGGLANKDTASVLAYRNRLLKTWAASIAAMGYVDYDAMSKDAHRPPPLASDLHWMCWLRWPHIGQRGSGDVEQMRGANVLREPGSGAPVMGLRTTEDGACADEMNRSLWQVLFNMFMKHRWEEEKKGRGIG